MLLTLRGTYFWPGQLRDAQSWVETCKLRQSVKPRPQHARLQPYKTPQIAQCIQTDLLGPLPESSSGARYVAIFVDHATLFCELVALKHGDAVSVASAFVDHWCCRYGFPRQLVTDLVPCYANDLMRTVCDLLNVKLGHCSPGHHQSNSRAEHLCKVILRNLKLLTQEQDAWEMYLYSIALAHRVIKIASTGLTPFERMLMRPPVLSFELNIGKEIVYKPDTQTYMEMTKKKLELTQKVIELNIADANKISAKYYDRSASDRTFEKGERV
jgi:hypothetical protein